MKKAISLLIISFCVLLAFGCKNYGNKLGFNKGELFYKEPVTYEEALSVGEYLQDSIKLFKGQEISMQLIKRNDRFVLRGVYDKGADKDDTLIVAAKSMTYYLSRGALQNKPIDFEICNQKFETVKLVKGDN